MRILCIYYEDWDLNGCNCEGLTPLLLYIENFCKFRLILANARVGLPI